MDGAADKAAEHAGSSGSKDLFSSVLGAITEKKGSLEKEDIDEEGASTLSSESLFSAFISLLFAAICLQIQC